MREKPIEHRTGQPQRNYYVIRDSNGNRVGPHGTERALIINCARDWFLKSDPRQQFSVSCERPVALFSPGSETPDTVYEYPDADLGCQ